MAHVGTDDRFIDPLLLAHITAKSGHIYLSISRGCCLLCSCSLVAPLFVQIRRRREREAARYARRLPCRLSVTWTAGRRSPESRARRGGASCQFAHLLLSESKGAREEGSLCCLFSPDGGRLVRALLRARRHADAALSAAKLLRGSSRSRRRRRRRRRAAEEEEEPARQSKQVP